MNLTRAFTILSLIILCGSCNKDEFVEPPSLCLTPSTDIQFIRNSIIGEWNSTENHRPHFERQYEVSLTIDSLSAIRINKFKDPDEEVQMFYEYSIDPGTNNVPDEFIIKLYTLGVASRIIKFCENEFIIFYDEEGKYWEKYTRI